MLTRSARRLLSAVACMLAAGALGATVLQPPATRAQTATPLTGETFIGPQPTYDPGATCTPQGSSFTYRVAGQASPPYAGTFEEVGQVVLGPLGPTFFEATFEIVSVSELGETTVTGTKRLVAPGAQDIGRCVDLNRPSYAVEIFNLTYQAEISGPTGTFQDQGQAQVFIRPFDSPASFRQQFVLSSGPPTPTSTSTSTPTPLPTDTPTPTSTPTPTDTPTPTPTDTPTPTTIPTATPTNTPTNTPTPADTPTATSVPTATPTSVPSATATVVGADLAWDPLESTCRHASLSIL